MRSLGVVFRSCNGVRVALDAEICRRSGVVQSRRILVLLALGGCRAGNSEVEAMWLESICVSWRAFVG